MKIKTYPQHNHMIFLWITCLYNVLMFFLLIFAKTPMMRALLETKIDHEKNLSAQQN